MKDLKEELNKYKVIPEWIIRNEYKVIPEKIYAANENIRILIDPSWQGTNRLFVLAYLNDATSAANSYRKYFLPRLRIKSYNIETDGRNFYEHPINDLIK